MHWFDATEEAYKNGYEKGKKDAEKKLVRCGQCKRYDRELGVCEFWHGKRNPGHFCKEGEQR